LSSVRNYETYVEILTYVANRTDETGGCNVKEIVENANFNIVSSQMVRAFLEKGMKEGFIKRMFKLRYNQEVGFYYWTRKTLPVTILQNKKLAEFARLPRIIREFRKLVSSSNEFERKVLYDLMSMVRGPDNTTCQAIKSRFSGKIRFLLMGSMLPTGGVVRNEDPITEDDLIEANKNLLRFVRSDHVSHYTSHAYTALQSLEKLIKTEEVLK